MTSVVRTTAHAWAPERAISPIFKRRVFADKPAIRIVRDADTMSGAWGGDLRDGEHRAEQQAIGAASANA